MSGRGGIVADGASRLAKGRREERAREEQQAQGVVLQRPWWRRAVGVVIRPFATTHSDEKPSGQTLF